MDNKEEIVQQFAKYCAQCNGKCCKRGVFSVFGWEMDKLSAVHKNFEDGRVSDERGSCTDIAMFSQCIFSKENGCRLSMDLRPTDCLTYPFYPKSINDDGELKIDTFVIDKECTFYKEIAEDKELLKSVHKYWRRMVKKVNHQEIVDWIGRDGCWHKWYKNAIEVKE